MTKFTKAISTAGFTAGILFAAILCPASDPPARMENRFLFVVETSSAMRSRTNGINEAVLGLLKSNIHGELRKGDTLGLWTYNERLHDDFPRQIWSKENKDSIISDVKRYLDHEHYEKRAHLEKVLSAVGQVLHSSERLTIIFVYDGTQLIRGTQFDDDINGVQKESIRQFRSAHMPMVTVLVARQGEVYDYTINYPSDVRIPHTAFPEPPTNAPPTNAVAAAAAPIVPVAPKPHRRIEIVMVGTNRPEPMPASNSAPSAPSNLVVSATPSESTPSNAVVATPTPKPPPAAPVIAAPVAVAPSASNPPLAEPAPSPKPAAIATEPPANPNPLATEPKIVPEPTPAPSPLPAPAPAASTSQQIALFVIAISLLTIAVVLVILLIRRSRGNSRPSLISQSIDRGQ